MEEKKRAKCRASALFGYTALHFPMSSSQVAFESYPFLCLTLDLNLSLTLITDDQLYLLSHSAPRLCVGRWKSSNLLLAWLVPPTTKASFWKISRSPQPPTISLAYKKIQHLKGWKSFRKALARTKGNKQQDTNLLLWHHMFLNAFPVRSLTCTWVILNSKSKRELWRYFTGVPEFKASWACCRHAGILGIPSLELSGEEEILREGRVDMFFRQCLGDW